jgi:hypothetical protein
MAVARNERERLARRLAMLRWAAGLGAVTAEALATRERSTLRSARARLLAAEREGLLLRARPLAARPALYTVTRSGLRACGRPQLSPGAVGAGSAEHAIARAAAAVVLERRFPDRRVIGEAELRPAERDRGRPLASAVLAAGPGGVPRLHRPDLVLLPRGSRADAPIAVEVELTVKAPARLLAICLAWARCREVAGVLYLATEPAAAALARAVERACAQDRIAVVALEPAEAPICSAIPRDAQGAPADAARLNRP